MPARVLVCCKRSVAHVTRAMLEGELHAADLMTLAEPLEIPGGEEAAVGAMWEAFHLDMEGQSAEIRWHATQRPIQISWGPPLAGEIDETLENLPKSRSKGGKRVREHLAASCEVVSFEMGIDGSHHLAATLSEVLAFFFAEQGDGVVWFYQRELAFPDDRGATVWTTS